MKLFYNRTGQTLLEVIFAMLILVTALTATIVLIVTSINASRESRNKLIATNLAREAVEQIRDIRDSNWIDPASGVDWDAGLDADTTAGLVFDGSSPVTLDFAVNSFSDTGAAVLLNANDFYVQGGVATGATSSFYRLIYVNTICHDASGNENIADRDNADVCGVGVHSAYPNKTGIRVIAEVRWPSSTGRRVVLEDRLYNWQQL